jgi:mRNA interferase MazF
MIECGSNHHGMSAQPVNVRGQRTSLTRPEAEIDGRKCRILLEQMLGVDITKLSHWIGVLDDDEMDALDDALRLYHGLL